MVRERDEIQGAGEHGGFAGAIGQRIAAREAIGLIGTEAITEEVGVEAQ